MMMSRSTLRRRLLVLGDIPLFYLRSAFRYGVHPLSALRSMAGALARGYHPDEAWRLGLLRPGVDARHVPVQVSKRALTRVLKQVNPTSWEPMLSDKGMFYRYCEHAGLPVPSLFGLFFKDRMGWTVFGKSPASIQEWEDVILHDLPDRFVVKPAAGAYGLGIRVLSKTGDLLQERRRGELTPRQLVKELQSDPGYDAFVIQEVLVNHPDLRRLSGSDGLQTCRMMTNLRSDGTVELLYACLRVIVGDNVIDNFQSGKTGNCLARIDSDSGRIHSGWTYLAEGGVVPLERHPQTGAVFVGLQLPHWQEALGLAEKAASAFSPIRTVGWDIALTPVGPVLLEGNIWYDPVSHSQQMDRIVERIVAVGR